MNEMTFKYQKKPTTDTSYLQPRAVFFAARFCAPKISMITKSNFTEIAVHYCPISSHSTFCNL